MPTAVEAPVGELPGATAPAELDYLTDGDIVALSPSGAITVLYRRESYHNTFLLTERCNNLCVMCSQPPREHDNTDRGGELLQMISWIDPATQEIGLSGGEPTLLGETFLEIVRRFAECLPETTLHVLTNGRTFQNRHFAVALAQVRHPRLILGIPLHADNDVEHERVVQRRGAFDQTVAGMHNLAQAGISIEVRVVLHGMTVRRLRQLADFIYRNLTFVSHVALMGLVNRPGFSGDLVT